MKKLISVFIVALFLSQVLVAQGKLYLVFEFMQVDQAKNNAYAETENFWEKIHKQSAMNGDILGWDLWSLQPGASNQGYQYMTVTLYDNPVSLMTGFSWDQLLANAKKAYPEMSEDEIVEKVNNSANTRNLAERFYLQQIDTTTGSFQMKVGIVASIDLMKAKDGQSWAYEKAEDEVFKPGHQKMVDAGVKGSWSLGRIMLPLGSRAITHVTVNMYKDYAQYFKSWEYDMGTQTEAQAAAVEKGLKTRDMKWVYMATLQKMVRK